MTEPRVIDRSQHRLLVVNDDPIGRYTTVRLLNAAGFPTLEAATGTQALEEAGLGVSAVVLDIHLPDIDGFELCRRLRAQASTFRLPVIHLTAAFLTDEDKVRGLDAGADAYLTHPVEPAVLVSTIQALVRTRAAEEAMRRSEAKFRAVYAQAPSGICLLSAQDGTVLDANPAMLALLGRDSLAVVGRPLREFVAPGDLARSQSFFNGLGADGVQAEFALISPLGHAVQVEWSASPHIEPGVCMAMAVDISQRVQLAEQRLQLLDRERSARGEAERLSRLKDDLIAVLSHELRTPLNAIMGWTHVLQRHSPPDLLTKGLAAIDRNVNIQARMISDILDMSRLNVGKLPLSLEQVTAGAVLRNAVAAIQHSIEESGHQLVLDLQGEDLVLHADSGRLQQVLWNLLGNAAKFSPRETAITLTLRPQDGGALIEVRDQGQGIAAEFLPHVFDRFTQSDAASNRHHGGLGLGLAIVKSLVEAHGGWVRVDSDGTGQGTRIAFWLPGAELGSVDPSADAETGSGALSGYGELNDAPSVALPGLRVLLVDDDADAGAMLRLILGERGARVTSVQSVDEALRTLTERSFDLLISDIGMPGRDGYELIRDWRSREAEGPQPPRRLPAIALTAFSREVDRQQALHAGFDAHLSKPLKPQLLLRVVEELSQRPG
ncbi:hybrid sensor histidine kinase/response regulator [Roseateles amylovorans]|uniref:histidine kinase n=1 Tax=Roseateles amylovorans TaxID=2978473 RepID=A0ABY6B5V5_9BURK|nr:response regulator [Roseateles amylovorans]UXH80560.1 response regulator [Roseateles amylovorans]